MTPVRRRELPASKLPEYKLGDSYKTPIGPDTEQCQRVIEVTCPRRPCRKTFVVIMRYWWRSRPGFIGRSCPYCFKANRLPRRPR